MNPILTFETKEQYLAWRAEWRAEYKQVSQDIRDLSLTCRAVQSGINRDRWTPNRERIIATMKKYTKTTEMPSMFWQLLHALWCRRAEAKQLLEWRKASKLRAQEQYLKAHPTASVPS